MAIAFMEGNEAITRAASAGHVGPAFRGCLVVIKAAAVALPTAVFGCL
jgi:hypothetical protein